MFSIEAMPVWRFLLGGVLLYYQDDFFSVVLLEEGSQFQEVS